MESGEVEVCWGRVGQGRGVEEWRYGGGRGGEIEGSQAREVAGEATGSRRAMVERRVGVRREERRGGGGCGGKGGR